MEKISSGQTDEGSKSWGSVWNRWLFVHIIIPIIAFLIGFVPMWWKGRSCANQLTSVQHTLILSSLQNTLANAATDARRGEYEPARQSASDFFTKLRVEVDRGSESAFANGQRSNLQPIFAERDNVVTLLARSDPSSVDRLMDLYMKYRQVVGSGGEK